MPKALAYSIFGYQHEAPESGFDFDSYLRGLWVNVRINRVLFPDWITVINADDETLHSPFKPIFDFMDGMKVRIIRRPSNQPLCIGMLWRFQTVFDYDHPSWTYSHTLCRDTDSIGTYRELQAVIQWIQEDRAAHCITDSISHNIPLMGGMCGFRPGYVNDRLKACDDPKFVFEELLNLAPDIDYRRKGSDQDFLMRVIYPRVQDSITAHFVLGMRQVVPEGNGMHYKISDIETPVDPVHKFLDTCAGHIGAAGYYETPMVKWLRHIDPFRGQYKDIERRFPRLMYWREA